MEFFDNSMIQALCRTFAHSLWQGLLLALIAGAVMQFTRKRTAAFRYNSLSLLLAGFLLAIGTTFVLELAPGDTISAATGGSGLSTSSVTEHYTPVNIASPAAENASLLASVQLKTNRFLHNYAGLIVGCWFVVFCFKLLNTFNGLKYIYRIRNHKVSEPEHYWLERVRAMQEKLKIAVKVTVLESQLVSVPAVTGFLKPVILLPFGMLSNLPVEQVEAILLHELAHIRRADYLVNLLQRFVETLFFFNPGVLWLSALIKDERENCCDDIAVGITGNKRSFVEALVAFQEYRGNTGAYALGIDGGKSSLLNRSRRLLYSSNRNLNTMEKSALSVCLVLLAAISFAFHGIQDKNGPLSPVAGTVPAGLQEDIFSAETSYADRNYDPDEIPEGTSIRFTDMVNGHSQPTWIFKSDDTLYQISGDIQLFKINGEVVPQENYKPYLPKIRQLMAAYRKQESALTGFLDEKRDKLSPRRKATPTAAPAVPRTTTTTTTTRRTVITTVTEEDGVIINTHTYSDSSTIISCGPLKLDSLYLPVAARTYVTSSLISHLPAVAEPAASKI